MQAKYIFTLVICVVCLSFAYGQQLPYSSQVNDTYFTWNPAMTAPTTYMRASGFYRQQWLGFDGAPRTAYVGLEMPLVDYNMSIGGALIADKTGPTSNNGIYLSYAYKLEEIFNRDDVFSIGISSSFNQFNFDPSNEIFNDSDDVLLATARNTKFYPSIGAGIHYTNNTDKWDGNAFYFGLSATQIYATNILIESGNFDRTLHFFGNVGTKLYYDNRFLFQPSVNINVLNAEIVDVLLNVNFEMEESFWAGIGFSSASEVAFQGGLILPDVGARYSELRVGVLANLAVTNKIRQFGPGFEVFVIYEMDRD